MIRDTSPLTDAAIDRLEAQAEALRSVYPYLDNERLIAMNEDFIRLAQATRSARRALVGFLESRYITSRTQGQEVIALCFLCASEWSAYPDTSGPTHAPDCPRVVAHQVLAGTGAIRSEAS